MTTAAATVRPHDAGLPVRAPAACHPRALNSRAAGGFVGVETLVVLVLMALLGAIAYPSYQAQMAKSRRADARQALLGLALQLERHHQAHGSYGGAALGAEGVAPALSAGGYYRLLILSQTADTFTIAAEPQGRQQDDACGTLAYNHLGDRSVSARAAAATPLDLCW